MSIEPVIPSNHLILFPFSSRLQSFPASGSFPMSQFFASGSQSIGVSASASVLLMNIQDWFPLGWTGWISLQSKGLSSVFYKHHTSKASILWCWAFFIFQISHLYMTSGKTKALTRQTFVGKVMSLLFNMLSRLVIIFLPRTKRLLISWLQSLPAVILAAAAAAAAKSLQLCPTLCDPIDGSPPGSAVPGILQARILKWVAISFSSSDLGAP